MFAEFKGSALAAGIIACVVALVVTPWVKQLAFRSGAIAKPDARRQHPEPIPQWGGLAIFLGVTVAALFWRQPSMTDLKFLNVRSLHLTTFFIGCGLLMLILGMVDDRFELKPIFKFGGQIAITFVLWYGHVRVNSMPFTQGLETLPDWESLSLTMLWVLGITNALNLIDGVDGLASGVAAIAAGSLCLIEQMQGATWAAAAAAAICGASLGFLRYNFNPAKIFLGDAGSLLLGFWLAAIGVAASAKAAEATTLALPMLVLGVPLFDTAWAVVRRTLAGQPPWRADRGHLHHRLLASGLSARQTVYVIYAICLLLGFAAWACVHHTESSNRARIESPHVGASIPSAFSTRLALR